MGLGGGEQWFGDDSKTLHLLCSLFLFCGNLRMFHLDFRVRDGIPMRILMLLLLWQKVGLRW